MWNKVLDAGNMTQASNYLLSKLAAGVNEEPHLVPSMLIGGICGVGRKTCCLKLINAPGNGLHRVKVRHCAGLDDPLLNSPLNNPLNPRPFPAVALCKDYKITAPHGNCNGRRVQVQLQLSPEGWRHNADGGDPSDTGQNAGRILVKPGGIPGGILSYLVSCFKIERAQDLGASIAYWEIGKWIEMA